MNRTRNVAVLTAFVGMAGWAAGQSGNVTPEQVQALLNRLAAQETRIQQLETKVQQLTGGPAAAAAVPVPVVPEPVTATPVESQPAAETQMDMGGHSMDMGSGPALKIRGFFDLNLGIGSDANPLIFPLGAPTHTSFQAGEFDLFMSSRLTKQLNFIAEVILGSDASNEWGLDIERAQLTYKPSPYLELSGGRYHVSIGYYNTAFHHGTWFQTATGRPFMYFFEDSGGILPVHGVGATATGLIPKTGKFDLHWIAEVSNGRSVSGFGSPVENFLADRNGKAFNLAIYSKPQWIPGLQVGGSYYHDRLYPVGAQAVEQSIASVYGVYTSSQWELLNEAVLLSNHQIGTGRTHQTPLAYGQIAHKFGITHPYFRYQYVNSPATDPVNVFLGRYNGPSLGVRLDLTAYAALKIQYNRLYQGPLIRPANGLDLQMAFAF